MPITAPAQISFPLDIPQVDVVATKQTQEGKFIITVESRQETTICGICQQEISCNYGVGQEIQLRHLPILGQETTIAIRPRRGRCPTCLHSPTTTQKLNWYEQRSPHTKAYDQYLMKQLIGSSVSDVSLKEKVGYDAILGTLKRQVGSEVNWDEIQNLATIGIDEVAYKKGHKHYRAVLTARQDDGTVTILAVLENRKKRQ
jgi:transposase